MMSASARLRLRLAVINRRKGMKKMRGLGIALFFFLIFCGCDSATDIEKTKNFYSHKDLQTSVKSDLSPPDNFRVVLVAPTKKKEGK